MNTREDLEAVAELIGCNTNNCPWEGVVEVQYHNALGPKWRSCRRHAAPYRADYQTTKAGINPDDYSVRDSGRSNRLLRPWLLGSNA